MERSSVGFVLVFDEIQKIPGKRSNTVKGLWDADRASGCPLHVFLGSAPLLIQSGLSESLIGRFESPTHWSFPEMSQPASRCMASSDFGGYRAGSRASRGFQFQDAVGAWFASRLASGDLAIDHLIPEGLDDLQLDAPEPTQVEVKSRQGPPTPGRFCRTAKMLGQLHDAGNTTTLIAISTCFRALACSSGLSKYSDQPHRGFKKLNILNTALMTADSNRFAEAIADRTFWGRIVESAVGAHLFNSARRILASTTGGRTLRSKWILCSLSADPGWSPSSKVRLKATRRRHGRVQPIAPQALRVMIADAVDANAEAGFEDRARFRSKPA